MITNDFTGANLVIAQNYSAMRAALTDPAAQAALDAIAGEVVLPAKVSHFLEFAYANKASFTTDQMSSAADVGNFAWLNGFYGLGSDNRGQYIEALLRGDALPDGATAPAVSPDYAPAPA